MRKQDVEDERASDSWVTHGDEVYFVRQRTP